jgi:DNA-directed RNA polymerase specialized sigma subunit
MSNLTGRRKRTKTMDERDRHICQLAADGKLSYSEIAALYHISKQRVAQIVKDKPHVTSPAASDNG